MGASEENVLRDRVKNREIYKYDHLKRGGDSVTGSGEVTVLLEAER